MIRHRSPSRAATIAVVAALALVAAISAAPLGAQGTVSGQGLGYPTGQLGTRAATMGGGPAEQDPESPVNPAALGLAPNTMLFLQYSPEFRTLEFDGRTERTNALRFPLIGGYARLGDRSRIGVTFASLLDRTFSVAVADTEQVGGGAQAYENRFRSEGGIGDARLATSWRFGSRLHVGAGLHAITGSNRIAVSRSYGDTLLLPLENRSLSFSGGALSAGFALQALPRLNVAASLRRGGDLRARSGDTVLARARVPDRFGAGVQFTGIRGTTIGARTEYTTWSNMAGLGSGQVRAFDTWEFGAGADIDGPRVAARPLMLRVGARWRELPFGVSGEKVSELEVGGGLGIQLPFERAMIDLGARRATRSAAGIDERGWTLSFGASVRP